MTDQEKPRPDRFVYTEEDVKALEVRDPTEKEKAFLEANPPPAPPPPRD